MSRVLLAGDQVGPSAADSIILQFSSLSHSASFCPNAIHPVQRGWRWVDLQFPFLELQMQRLSLIRRINGHCTDHSLMRRSILHFHRRKTVAHPRFSKEPFLCTGEPLAPFPLSDFHSTLSVRGTS